MSVKTEYFAEQDFENIDYSDGKVAKGEYESCVFRHCNFSNADMTGILFSDCDFIGCNLSLAKSTDAAFRDVRFKNSKLLGFRFDVCNDFLFAVHFEKCVLNLASFYAMKVPKTQFRNCTLHETDFSGADLTDAIFAESDLDRAIFSGTILEKADFRTAYHYAINPETNRIKKAKFSLDGLLGLLGQYDIDVE